MPSNNKSETPHFSRIEFKCKCDRHQQDLSMGFQVVPALYDVLEFIRESVNEPIRVTSGYRCKEHNLATPGAASNSWHLLRDKKLYAADITYGNAQNINRLNILRLYVLADDFGARGLGLYNGRIHKDQTGAQDGFMLIITGARLLPRETR